MRITGTFLDEITCDIPSNNWGPREWAREFRLMAAVGIDTVLMIRSGFGKSIAFPSEVLAREVNAYPVWLDYADLFLDLAERHGMRFFFPTYDSNTFWRTNDIERELNVNLALVDEIWAKYGHRKAFAGWYLTHEYSRHMPEVVAGVRRLGLHCKQISGGLPTVMSPYIQGYKIAPDNALTLDEHIRDWEQVIAGLKGVVDIVAFQDGHVDYHELPAYLEANKRIIEGQGLECWSNVESFDRDMPFNFPPIDWRKMGWKMEAARQAGVGKLITFEFSHFMSPFSTWPAARNLFLRYCEYLGLDGEAVIRQAEAAED